MVINTMSYNKQTLDILSTKNKQYSTWKERREKRFSKIFEDGSNADWTESRNGSTRLASHCMYVFW